MCCSSGEVHPFIWTKSIISQHKYDSRKLSASLMLAACLSWCIGGLEILVVREGLCFPPSEGNDCCYYCDITLLCSL